MTMTPAARSAHSRPAAKLMMTAMLALLGTACSESPETTASGDGAGQVITIELQAATPATLPRCDDSLAGATAYVESPVSLWSCQTGAWVSVPCTKGLAGTVAFASASQTLLSCTKSVWTPIMLPAGATGATGATGAQGPMGARGAPGTVLAVSVEPPGANCPAGGQKIDLGPDTNGNGSLDGSEATRTVYVCDGEMGATGATGAPGPKGDPGERGPSGVTTLAAAATETAGANCAKGGVKLSTGVDINGNGVLDGTEGADVTYICNGADGSDGAPGAKGKDGAISLVSATPEPAGAACVNGGVRIDTGVDGDADGALATGEIAHTAYVCNGGTSTRIARFDDPTCDPAVVPDAEHGVFADAMNGDDVLGTGDPGAPVQTVVKALALAAAKVKPSVYLAPGIYTGIATLHAGSAIYVEGGWLHGALGSWTRNCDATAREGTVLSAVVANGVGGLRSLTVRAENGSSNIAVRVAAGTLKIRDCALLAGDARNASAGLDGAPGLAGAIGNACTNGAAGIPAAPATNSAGGSFAAAGTFQPGSGGTATVTSDQNGRDGSAAAPATCTIGQCRTDTVFRADPYCGSYTSTYPCNPHSCGCSFFGGCDTCYDTCYQTNYISCNVPVSCSWIPTGTQTVSGTCGQGGRAGSPGGGGGGGGASVALVIASGASVDVVGSSFAAKHGGGGARGGAGGPGGPGGVGQAQSCAQTNCWNPPPCGTTSTPMFSSPGGRGGDGAAGPAGGSGAGGPSYGIVKLGTAGLTIDAASTISFDEGGAGGPGAADGAAQPIATF